MYDRGKKKKQEEGTHSGKISDVRKSLAGGREGRIGLGLVSCVSVLTETDTSVPRGRRAFDCLLLGRKTRE